MKSTKKTMAFFTAAIMTAALFGSQVSCPIAYGYEERLEKSSLIPENVTIDQPTALSNIALPENDYGILSWAEESFVPTERVQSCRVEFEPFDFVDVSHLSGWDEEEGVLTAKITVVVTGISDYEPPCEKEGEQDEEAVPEMPEEISGSPTETPAAEEIPVHPGSPEASVMPETPDFSETAPSVSPELETSPEPSISATPEAFLTPEPSDLPEEGMSSQEALSAETEPSVSPEPEVSPQPDDSLETPIPEASPAPEPSEAPAEEEILLSLPAVPQPSETPDKVENVEEQSPVPEEQPNIFDNPEQVVPEDTRPVTAEETMTSEEEMARAAENHRCGGISVSGVHLPWYVQFRVSSGSEYQFTNEEEASVFQSYEFELWDLKNNTEYQIPDGEYISVTIPVKEGYEYVIEHLLDNGAMETIIPSVSGSTMVFSTHSFSPFGIAGSRPLVGEEIAKEEYPKSGSDAAVPSPTSAASKTGQGTAAPIPSSSPFTAKGASTPGQNTTGQGAGAAPTQGSQAPSSSENSSGGSLVNAVLTGDETPVEALAVLLLGAAAVAGAAGIKKRKRM